MAPRHPPRALKNLTTPIRRRIASRRCRSGGPSWVDVRGVSRRERPPPVTIPLPKGSTFVEILCHYHTWLCDELPNCKRANGSGDPPASGPGPSLAGVPVRLASSSPRWPPARRRGRSCVGRASCPVVLGVHLSIRIFRRTRLRGSWPVPNLSGPRASLLSTYYAGRARGVRPPP